MTHGKASSYKNGCRCAVCRGAFRVWMRDYFHRTGRHRPRAEYDAERTRRKAQAPHGTEASYTNRGCRCADCKRASAEARQRRRMRYKVAA